MNEIAFPAPAIGRRPAGHPQMSCGAVGVLLVNLGTPDATDAKSVRRYLREFLHDKRVIEEDTITWKFGGVDPFWPKGWYSMRPKRWHKPP
jgi:hypothetical protein